MSAEQAAAPPQFFDVIDPELEGVELQVQRGYKRGDEPSTPTAEPGTLGFGVVIVASGQPQLMLQLKHADGTCLGAYIGADDNLILRQIWEEQTLKAIAISKAAREQEGGRPS